MVSYKDIERAKRRISDEARLTPLEFSHNFSTLSGCNVYIKLENHQRTGSFKIRGATNKIRLLSEKQKESGVVTASAGNHAQGVALAAELQNVSSKIVMPETAPHAKVEATEEYGGEVVLYGDSYSEAREKAKEIEHKEKRVYIPAFDDEEVISGQGTIGLEILSQKESIDTIVVPIGGGGLISGVCLAVKEDNPNIRIVGVQSENASSASQSLEKGWKVETDTEDTIADGISVNKVGDIPFEIMDEYVDEIVTVSDNEICKAVLYSLERSKTVLEGAGAVPLAALISDKIDVDSNEEVVSICSGGNVDMNSLKKMINTGMMETGRVMEIKTVLSDKPGALHRLTKSISEAGGNIYAIHHDRNSRDISLTNAEVALEIQTKDEEHIEDLLERLDEAGYDIERIK